VNSLLGGQVDFIFKIPSELVSSLEGQSNVTLIQKATNQHPVIRLRTDEGPGASVEVRQAFKYATDRELLNQIVLQGQGVIGNNDPIGPSFGAFFNSGIENQTYDPARACELLTEAGYPDGLDLTIYTPRALSYDTLLAPALKEQWEPACIRVEIEAQDETFYYSDENPNNWLTAELGITGWSDQATAQSYLVQAYVTGGIYNETRWSDPELDDLVAQAGVVADQTERAAIYNQIAAIFAERGPIIVPWFAPIFGATSSSVQGLDMAPFPGLTDLRGVSISS
jgi:peptide/nickel transport system substrate-binding protein